jgi:hypothetical protein
MYRLNKGNGKSKTPRGPVSNSRQFVPAVKALRIHHRISPTPVSASPLSFFSLSFLFLPVIVSIAWSVILYDLHQFLFIFIIFALSLNCHSDHFSQVNRPSCPTSRSSPSPSSTSSPPVRWLVCLRYDFLDTAENQMQSISLFEAGVLSARSSVANVSPRTDRSLLCTMLQSPPSCGRAMPPSQGIRRALFYKEPLN